jgi:hypothetical protein
MTGYRNLHKNKTYDEIELLLSFYTDSARQPLVGRREPLRRRRLLRFLSFSILDCSLH